MINHKKITMLIKKLKLKHKCQDQIYVILVMHILWCIILWCILKAEAFKNNAPFINCISAINGVKIDNTEDLDVVMAM